MKIFQDAELYISLQDWARSTFKTLGYEGARELKSKIDGAIRKGKKSDNEKLRGMSFSLMQEIQRARIGGLIEGVESQKQASKRARRQTWRGMSRDQISKRNETIIEDFKKSRLNHPSTFAIKNANKYGISARTIRLIIQKAVGN